LVRAMSALLRPGPSCLALSLTLLLAACGQPAVSIEKTNFAPSLMVDLSQSTKTSNMYVRDLLVGAGISPQSGQVVTMKYTGWLADGTQFDSNQTTGFQFHFGAGEVIAGWEVGVSGMRVGGTRQLIIPPELGYGSTGQGPIPPNAVLVFTVTMVNVQ
jgi:FKBP-type peptidyl-prolyl cis-trans isomerase